jgi:hypothetical protein
MEPHSYQRKLGKREGGIVGGWISEAGKIRADDNTLRIEWLVENCLNKTGIQDGGWTTNYQDPEDGRYWQRTYPKSYMHGGGPPMLEHITPVTKAYRQIKEALTAPLHARLYDDVIDELHDFETFGSRYIVWSNNQRAIRLIWDGKDSDFVLECANALPLSYDTLWDEIERCAFSPQQNDPLEATSIATKMSDSLIEWKYN